MRIAITAIILVALSACATAPPYPGKRPITESVARSIGAAPVVLIENNNGIEKTWFMTDSSVATAQYGFLGALVGGIMDSIINAGPSHRAEKAANELANVVSCDRVNASMLQAFKSQIASGAAKPQGISLSSISMVQKTLVPDAPERAVEVSATYALSEDASALRVVAHASYSAADLKYATPYDFQGKVPKSELTGPVYANNFTYNSSQLPAPTLTPELKDRLVAAIEESYKDDSGAAPAATSKEFKAMSKELNDARDDKLTIPEIAIFLTREWLKDGGARLRQEIDQASAFVARYVAVDLNTTAIPTVAGQDEFLETLADKRTVRRVGAGTTAGSYQSSPGEVAAFVTYGNVSGIAKVNVERVKRLREEAKHSKSATAK